MGFVSVGENVAAHAAGSPARATDGPGPSTAYTHVRFALLNRDWVVGAGAAVVVGIVPGGICGVVVVVCIGARGMPREPLVCSPDTGPRERVPIVVRDAALDGMAGRNPRLRGLLSSFGVGHSPSREAAVADVARTHGSGAAVARELAGGAVGRRRRGVGRTGWIAGRTAGGGVDSTQPDGVIGGGRRRSQEWNGRIGCWRAGSFGGGGGVGGEVARNTCGFRVEATEYFTGTRAV